MRKTSLWRSYFLLSASLFVGLIAHGQKNKVFLKVIVGVYSSDTLPQTDADVILRTTSGEIITTHKTDRYGDLKVNVPMDTEYIIEIRIQGHVPAWIHVNTQNIPPDRKSRDYLIEHSMLILKPGNVFDRPEVFYAIRYNPDMGFFELYFKE